jgi:hypothetical protein
MLKPFEKKKKENAIDDDLSRPPNKSISQSKNFSSLLMTKDSATQSNRTKPVISNNYSVNFPKFNKKLGGKIFIQFNFKY